MRLVRRQPLLVSAVIACALAAACGDSESPTVTLTTPTATGAVSAPVPQSPVGEEQLDTLRPTLRVANATSSQGGTKTYEFQTADNPEFRAAGSPGSFVTFAYRVGVPEGGDGRTTVTFDVDLQPTTRFYWRARAYLEGAPGPWSSTATFKTKVQAFINGTSVYDPLIGTPSVGETRGIFYFPAGDPFGAGAKIDDGTSYISYRLGSPLTEGEVSFNATRIKTGDSSFDNQYRVITMQDGTGDIATNAWRVSADKRSPADGGRGRLEFFVNGASSGRVESGPQSWDERKTYFLRLEWRAGTARFRIYDGNTDGAPLKIDLSTSYSGTYSPPNHVINIGTRNGETMRDMRVSNVWISAQPRPASLGSALDR